MKSIPFSEMRASNPDQASIRFIAGTLKRLPLALQFRVSLPPVRHGTIRRRTLFADRGNEGRVKDQRA